MLSRAASFFLLIPALIVNQAEPPGTLTVLAGTGKLGYSGDGGPALSALLNQPFHCDLDGKGNLYYVEAFNHCLRKIDLKSGTISTVAGTGKRGYSGDGGPALKASMGEPYAVVVSKEGDLYIADRLNAAVRKIDAKTGIITTVAGTGKAGYSGDDGPGDKAQLREPNDLCFDHKGGLLIADVKDWRVRRLDLATGVITTFAGTGPQKGRPDRAKAGDGGQAAKAVIGGARGVCALADGTVFICEREGGVIRRVDPQGVITTIAGTGAVGYAGDGGPALAAIFREPKGIRADSAGTLYVVDTDNHAFRKIDMKTGVVTTVAGGRKGAEGIGGPAAQAGMGRPHGCVIDANGIMFIADSENHRVLKVALRSE